MKAASSKRLHLWQLIAALIAAGACAICVPAVAAAAGGSVAAASSPAAGAPSGEGNQLESAASRAGATGRRVAMSLIGLGFALAAIMLAFRRDFKEAIGVFAVGIAAVLLAQESGVKLVENLVHALFGA